MLMLQIVFSFIIKVKWKFECSMSSSYPPMVVCGGNFRLFYSKVNSAFFFECCQYQSYYKCLPAATSLKYPLFFLLFDFFSDDVICHFLVINEHSSKILNMFLLDYVIMRFVAILIWVMHWQLTVAPLLLRLKIDSKRLLLLTYDLVLFICSYELVLRVHVA